MNKYQREKAKRMKKLSDLGIPYYKQKKFIKLFKDDLVNLDEAIQKAEIFKKMPPVQRLLNFIEGLYENK